MAFPTFPSPIRGLLSPFKFIPAVLAVTALTACASLKPPGSPLPVEVRQSGSGQIMSFRAHESSDRLYVVGIARKHRLSNAAHVDIQLIGSSGAILAEDQNDINPAHPAHGGGKLFRDSYVVSFPLRTARQAVKIRVIYHRSPHPHS